MPNGWVQPGTGPRPEGDRWDRTPTRFGFVRSAALIFVLIAAVTIVVRDAYYGPGIGIADRIRNAHSPVVSTVIYRDPNLWGGPAGEVWVYLGHDTTQAEVDAFWCDVVVPAGGSEMYSKQHLRLFQADQQAGDRGYFYPDTGCPD